MILLLVLVQHEIRKQIFTRVIEAFNSSIPGAPVIVVGVTAGLSPQGYGNDQL